eukprot:578042_1
MSSLSCTCSSVSFTKPSPTSTDIEQRMELAKEIANNTMRVLLVGPRNSGKTTILTQIKRINNKYDTVHLAERRKIIADIQSAIIEYIQTLCRQSDVLYQNHHKNTLTDSKYSDLLQEILQLKPPFYLTPDIGCKIQTLWRDQGIKETLRNRRHFQIDDNVQHFLDKVQEVSSANYLPEFDDYLRFRQRSIGVAQTKITCDDHNFEFMDMKGQRCARKKWIHFISDIDAILYVLPIADYDLVSGEDNVSNCLVEAINSFRDIMIKGKFFQDKLLMVLFNKFDVFKKKIMEVPITVALDDFPGCGLNAKDASDVVRFVAVWFDLLLRNCIVFLKSIRLYPRRHFILYELLRWISIKSKALCLMSPIS